MTEEEREHLLSDRKALDLEVGKSAAASWERLQALVPLLMKPPPDPNLMGVRAGEAANALSRFAELCFELAESNHRLAKAARAGQLKQ
jgi:hypothetical protein